MCFWWPDPQLTIGISVPHMRSFNRSMDTFSTFAKFSIITETIQTSTIASSLNSVFSTIISNRRNSTRKISLVRLSLPFRIRKICSIVFTNWSRIIFSSSQQSPFELPLSRLRRQISCVVVFSENKSFECVRLLVILFVRCRVSLLFYYPLEDKISKSRKRRTDEREIYANTRDYVQNRQGKEMSRSFFKRLLQLGVFPEHSTP